MAHLLYFVTEDWFFCSHFIERAGAARRAGHRVSVLTRVSHDAGRIRAAGLELVPLHLERHGINPLAELRLLWRVLRAYRRCRPDLVHQFALKPILHGTLAARLLRLTGQRLAVINAPVGMGFVFTSEQRLARWLRPLLNLGLRWLLNPPGSRVVFENGDDLDAAVREGLARRPAVELIRGAGVDVRRFTPRAGAGSRPGTGAPVVILVARLLWDKGVGEYVEAARLLHRAGVRARLWLVGAPDAGNPAAVPVAQLRAWHNAGLIEWLGPRRDVATLLQRAQIACLPSYREGLPKALLEALACGLPVITTDVPGCRELVQPGVNGLLVAPRDASALAKVLAGLLQEPGLQQAFGRAARRLAAREFTTERVQRQTLALYQRVLPLKP